MNCDHKAFIAAHEKESQENLASLIEIIAQFQGYRDRALFHNKEYVTIEMNNWQLQITALLNITSSLAGDLKMNRHLLKLAVFNESLREIISNAQVERISKELLEQLKST